MIDTQLIEQAQGCSPVIQVVDESWRSYVENLRKNILTIPFRGTYGLLLEQDHILIEGFKGTLVIDKLCHKQMYRLKQPVRQEPFTMYGVFDGSGCFSCFIVRPEIGVHFLGMSHIGHAVCTGDLDYQPPESLEHLKEVCHRIMTSLQIINLHSLGTVLLPDEYADLKSALSDKNRDNDLVVRELLKQGVVEPLL